MRTTGGGKGYAGVAAGLFLAGTVTAQAQQLTATTPTVNNNKQLGSARIVEWDLPADADFNPGAMVVDTRGEDNNTIWFVTRQGGQKVYRFNLQQSLMKNGGPARWTSWDLVPGLNMGGIKKLRPSHDRRFVVVRTSSSIQEVDTQACPSGTPLFPTACPNGLRRWDFSDPESPDPDSFLVSDIAVDDSRRIFSVGRSQAFQTGYVQVLNPTKVAFTSSTNPINAPVGTVTRWHVDGVDQCQSFGISGFCNSGIDFRPSNQNLVYFADQVSFGTTIIDGEVIGIGAIGELNLSNGQIRRWPMPLDANGQQVAQPRQLKIDSNDTVWAITGSGHLVSVNAKNSSGCPAGKNRVTRHRIPPEVFQNDGFGIAPDSNVVGYTDANNNKVGMLLPHDAGVCEEAVPDTATNMDIPSTVTTVQTFVASDIVNGDPKTALKQTTPKSDGTFVEAVINMPAPGFVDPTMKQPDSLSPLGITPARSKSQGTFFYAVGLSAGTNPAQCPCPAKRVGFVRLGVPERINNPRDDDDDDDGFTTANPNWRIGHAGDDDGDGVDDQYDGKTSKENMTGYDPSPLPAMNTTDYTVSTSATSLGLIASAQADNPTATLAVDVYNAVGTLVGTSGPLVGIAAVTVPTPGAGNFIVRVRNLSGSSVNQTPTIVVREPAVVQQ
jgi:hypothetical protein